MSLDNLHSIKRCEIKYLKGFKPYSLPSIFFNRLQYIQFYSIDSIALNAFKLMASNNISKTRWKFR